MGPQRVDGDPRPFRVPALRLIPWFGRLASAGALPPCGHGNFEVCRHDEAKCRAERRELGGVSWPTCPVRFAVDSPAIAYVMRLHRDMQAAPIGGWTHRFAAWVPPAVEAYAQEVTRAAEGG